MNENLSASGEVRDIGGKAIGGAHVSLQKEGPVLFGYETLVETATDANGRYSLDFGIIESGRSKATTMELTVPYAEIALEELGQTIALPAYSLTLIRYR